MDDFFFVRVLALLVGWFRVVNSYGFLCGSWFEIWYFVLSWGVGIGLVVVGEVVIRLGEWMIYVFITFRFY